MLTANSTQIRKARSTTSINPQLVDGKGELGHGTVNVAWQRYHRTHRCTENSPPEADRHVISRKSETWDDWEEPWPEQSSRSSKVCTVDNTPASVQPRPQSARRLSALAKARSVARSNSAAHTDERWKAVSASADATLLVKGADWSASPTQGDDNRLANQLARFEATIVDKVRWAIRRIVVDSSPVDQPRATRPYRPLGV